MSTDPNVQTRPADESAWRLPPGVLPVRYELHLAPDLGAATFTGTVSIECDISEATSSVVLNAADLDIETAVVRVGDRQLEVSGTSVDEDVERVTIQLAEKLSPGDSATVTVTFTGILNDQLRGFYLSKFTPVGGAPGETGAIATTHFEPTDARRAFPCFDEPDLKAIFSITVDVPAGLGVWSNWSVVREEPLDGGARRVRFGDSMIMSTYLVAVVVGPLEQTDPVDVDGTPVSIVHVPGKGHLTSFALEAAAHSIRFFSEWFEIPYPAAKLDMIALPDFAMGAMENLGCITYRETALLVDPDNASLAELQRVAQVVNHEIAHMWFGDLVTMRWWEGIWLNEAFATFMEILCGDDFKPEWDLWTNFATKRELAMAIDGLHTTRPIEYPVGNPKEAEGMFDPLTYEKGAGVLRMLERYIGPEKFRDGIRLYLRRHSYGNTNTLDLWNALEETSGQPVGSIMDTWLYQGGFPLVQVKDGSPGGPQDDGTVTVSQEPFMYSPLPVSGNSAVGQLWEVPVMSRKVGVSEAGRTILGGEPVVLDLVGDGPAIVNAGGAGVYRVQYSPAHLSDLAARWEDLTTVERFYLLSDTWAAVVSAKSELADFLALAAVLVDETDPDVWGQVTMTLAFMEKAVPDEILPALAAYTRALVGPPFARLGWERRSGDSERVRSLRAQLLASLGTVGADPEVREESRTAHKAFLEQGAILDPDIAPAVVATVAASGGPEEYEAFLERYRNPATPQEEVRYLVALAGFKDPALAERSFDLAMTEVRSQNVPFFIVSLLLNRENGQATWDRMTDRWEELNSKLPGMLVTRMVDGVRLLCRDAKFAAGVRSFLATHPIPAGQQSVDQTGERLGVNVAFAARLAAGAGPVLAAATERLDIASGSGSAK